MIWMDSWGEQEVLFLAFMCWYLHLKVFCHSRARRHELTSWFVSQMCLWLILFKTCFVPGFASVCGWMFVLISCKYACMLVFCRRVKAEITALMIVCWPPCCERCCSDPRGKPGTQFSISHRGQCLYKACIITQEITLIDDGFLYV